MRLSTLLEYKRCFDMMKAYDLSDKAMTAEEYRDVLHAKSRFDFELNLITDATKVEVSNETP